MVIRYILIFHVLASISFCKEEKIEERTKTFEIVNKELISKAELPIFEFIAQYFNGSKTFDRIANDRGYIFYRAPLKAEIKIARKVILNLKDY